MPNTSKGFPYPVSTDDPNIPADIQSLAQAIDTYLNNYSQTTHTHTGVYATSEHNHDGVYSISAHTHAGYLTSADLAGYSQTTHNHDASYATTGHTHSNYIATSLISSTKGAVPVGTGTGVSTITPGANDYALLSDSSTATGLKWASLAAVGTVIPNTFSNIAVSGQTTVSSGQQSDTLTLSAGSNITITTNNTTKTVTIAGSNAGVTTHEAAADPHSQYLTTTEANSLYDQSGAASLAQTAAAAYTDTAISNLVNSAPSTLNTLKELSDALGGDAAFATTVTNSIAAKAPSASPTFTGTITTPLTTAGYVTTNSSGVISSVATIPNSGLTNSSITINGTDVSLGGSTSIATIPTQTGQSGKYLTTDGTNASWGTVSSYTAPTIGSTSIGSGDTVSTISALTLNNSTLTGTVTAGGGVGTNGQLLTSTGTGVQWAAAPVSLPTQTGNTGRYLTTDGTTASWEIINQVPSISGQSGKYLYTDGSTYSWQTISTANYSNGTNTGNANKVFYNNTGTLPTGTAAGDIYIQY